MSADPNRKTARTFQCRDALWDAFEQIAQELECSVDYLINEAMKQYAKQRNQGAARTPFPPLRSEPSTSMPAQGTGGAALRPPPSLYRPQGASNAPAPGTPAPMPPPSGPGGSLPPPPGRLSAPGRPLPSIPLPPPRSGAAPPTAHAQPPAHVQPPPATRATVPAVPSSVAGVVPPPIPSASPASRSFGPPPLGGSGGPSRSAVPPAPGIAARAAATREPSNGAALPAAQASSLTLVYNSERYPITKERFVIGRGKQSSDLTLKDPNVSRQHALVEFQNGTYFMVDMGSTNGVAYNGQRIARKPIAEGDVFRICDHDLRFTYH